MEIHRCSRCGVRHLRVGDLRRCKGCKPEEHGSKWAWEGTDYTTEVYIPAKGLEDLFDKLVQTYAVDPVSSIDAANGRGMFEAYMIVAGVDEETLMARLHEAIEWSRA